MSDCQFSDLTSLSPDGRGDWKSARVFQYFSFLSLNRSMVQVGVMLYLRCSLLQYARQVFLLRVFPPPQLATYCPAARPRAASLLVRTAHDALRSAEQRSRGGAGVQGSDGLEEQH